MQVCRAAAAWWDVSPLQPRRLFAPTPAFRFLSIVLNVVFQVWFFFFCYNGSVRDLVLPNGTSVLVVHPVSKCSLCADCLGGERADCLLLSSGWSLVWGCSSCGLAGDTRQQIVSALTDGAVELELFSSAVEIRFSPRLACVRWRHIRLYLPRSGTWQTRAETAGSSLGPGGEPTQTSSPRWKTESDPVTG